MKIVHVSDTHGLLPELPSGDIVLHTGDFLPNRSRGVVDVETVHQMDWLRRHIIEIVDWIGDRPFLFVQGNHDYINPCPTLRDAGVDARNISCLSETVDGVK